jgi:hypothetical protein
MFVERLYSKRKLHQRRSRTPDVAFHIEVSEESRYSELSSWEIRFLNHCTK